MAWRAARIVVTLALALSIAGCSGDSDDAKPTPTTNPDERALSAVSKACTISNALGGYGHIRETLEHQGIDTTGLAEEDLTSRYNALLAAWSDEQESAEYARRAKKAADLAATAAAHDSRWDDLHAALSNYAAYLENIATMGTGGLGADDELERGFGVSRVACERAKAFRTSEE